MSAVYRPMSISKKNLLAPSALARAIHVFFKPYHSKFLIFHKNGILCEYLYVSHTLFILYLEGNHTLFGEKLYFIWKFSNGNTVLYIVYYRVSTKKYLLKTIYNIRAKNHPKEHIFVAVNVNSKLYPYPLCHS